MSNSNHSKQVAETIENSAEEFKDNSSPKRIASIDFVKGIAMIE